MIMDKSTSAQDTPTSTDPNQPTPAVPSAPASTATTSTAEHEHNIPDSKHESVITSTTAPRRTLRPQLTAPLRLQTDPSSSPFGQAETAYQPSTLRPSNSAPSGASHDNLTASPKAERLPSFRQLSKIAAAGEEDPQGPGAYPAPIYPPPPSLASHSPIMAREAPPPLQHTSPTTGYGYLPQSASLQRDPYYTNSPPSATFSAPPYYDRRRSTAYPNPPTLPGAPSQTSSTDSHGQHSSVTTEGYSTSQTTPTESGVSLESATRPTLPPIPSLQHSSSSGPATFVCDFPGCNAAPFQTQYLLNSHANVHSSNRPHYCPVQGCPRAEGGKGFKRKNEMIRHGLVHDSPGYMCPFCPDREHKYPRPDNLQRHVRVHHIDKDKDDPALREVMSQRAEGGNRGRRRRTGP